MLVTTLHMYWLEPDAHRPTANNPATAVEPWRRTFLGSAPCFKSGQGNWHTHMGSARAHEAQARAHTHTQPISISTARLDAISNRPVDSVLEMH